MDNACSKITIGSAQFGSNYGVSNLNGELDSPEIIKILNYAYSIGINTIDTAQLYGNSESKIGKYLNEYKYERWNIITKYTNDFDVDLSYNNTFNLIGFKPKYIMAHKLNDYLNSEFRKKIFDLKNKHNIENIGVSLYNVDEIDHLTKVELPDFVQIPLSIVDKRFYKNNLLNKLKEKKIKIHARSIFLQGLFFLNDDIINKKFPSVFETIKKIKTISSESNLKLHEVSLIWVNSIQEIDKCIVGVMSKNELMNHVETLKKKIDPKNLNKILSINYDNLKVLNPTFW